MIIQDIKRIAIVCAIVMSVFLLSKCALIERIAESPSSGWVSWDEDGAELKLEESHQNQESGVTKEEKTCLDGQQSEK